MPRQHHTRKEVATRKDRLALCLVWLMVKNLEVRVTDDAGHDHNRPRSVIPHQGLRDPAVQSVRHLTQCGHVACLSLGVSASASLSSFSGLLSAMPSARTRAARKGLSLLVAPTGLPVLAILLSPKFLVLLLICNSFDVGYLLALSNSASSKPIGAEGLPLGMNWNAMTCPRPLSPH